MVSVNNLDNLHATYTFSSVAGKRLLRRVAGLDRDVPIYLIGLSCRRAICTAKMKDGLSAAYLFNFRVG